MADRHPTPLRLDDELRDWDSNRPADADTVRDVHALIGEIATLPVPVRPRADGWAAAMQLLACVEGRKVRRHRRVLHGERGRYRARESELTQLSVGLRVLLRLVRFALTAPHPYDTTSNSIPS